MCGCQQSHPAFRETCLFFISQLFRLFPSVASVCLNLSSLDLQPDSSILSQTQCPSPPPPAVEALCSKDGPNPENVSKRKRSSAMAAAAVNEKVPLKSNPFVNPQRSPPTFMNPPQLSFGQVSIVCYTVVLSSFRNIIRTVAVHEWRIWIWMWILQEGLVVGP